MRTEQQNPNTLNIDQLDTLSLVTAINAEDRIVADAVEKALPAIAQAVDAIADSLRRGGRLFYVGAGSSGRLGVLDASECPPTYGVTPETIQGLIAGGVGAMFAAREGAEDDYDAGGTDLQAHDLSADDAVVGIAASGRTPYVLGALAYAKKVGASTIALANNSPAPILEAADIAIAVVTGPEVVMGSTRMKAGSAQKMVLNMLSTGAMVKLGKVYGNLMIDMVVKNEKLLGRARWVVGQIGGVDDAQAAALLEAAANNIKVAIVMARRQVTVDEAHALLAAADGMLRPVID